MDSGDTSDDIEVYLKQYEVLQAFDKKFEGFLGQKLAQMNSRQDAAE